MDRIDDVGKDLANMIPCEDGTECPAESTCSTSEFGKYCRCLSSMNLTKKDGVCPPAPAVSEHIGVISLDAPKFGHNINPTQSGSGNGTQTTTGITGDHPLTDESINLAVKVFIPIAGTLVIILIIIAVLLRHFRLCLRNKKRGRNSPVVKTSENIQLLDRMNVVNKNPSYFVTNGTGGDKEINAQDIPIEWIKLLDAVGEGAFGQVFKGELFTEGSEGSRSIAVKVLKEGVSTEAREDFEREVEIMSAFDHDNILKLLGVVSNNGSDTPYMIFEYMVHGDLAELLRKNDVSIRNSDQCTLKLQKTDLTDITTQISNGMMYLTSQHFVHRDLATRNCLVGERLVVKISDFGMSRDIYTCDYYKIGGSRMLPVRWMSPEAVKWGRFTTESDIWAFGVVLWEIFNYGRQPYYGHTNEEVIRFLDEGILLQRPGECPSVVYHVMLQCWKLDPQERMPFSRIHKYLTEYSKQLSRTNHNTSLDGTDDYEIPI